MRQPCARFLRLVAVLLAIQTGTSPLLHAKSITPLQVHERIEKRGVDAVLWLRKSNGIVLSGRVNTIGADSFSLQLWNDPNLVEVRYADVVELRQGLTTRGIITFTAIGVGATVGLAIYGIHEAHSNADKGLPTPTLPSPTFR